MSLKQYSKLIHTNVFLQQKCLKYPTKYPKNSLKLAKKKNTLKIK